MRLSGIYDAIATEMRQQETQSKKAIIRAMTSYCVALKASGHEAPLWSERGLLRGVHNRLEAERGNL
tara:strand:- start:3151 stop:3351 length:201 start_codon:yes stop_codon:yes gene_type:complete